MATPPKGFWDSLTPEQRRAALDYRGDEDHGRQFFLACSTPLEVSRNVEFPALEGRHNRQVGPWVETLTMTESRVTVTYRGPPIPPELEAELAAFWRVQLDNIVRRVLGQIPARFEPPLPASQPPARRGIFGVVTS